MTSGELTNLVEHIINRQYESQTIELKKAKDGAPKNLYDTLSSFRIMERESSVIQLPR